MPTGRPTAFGLLFIATLLSLGVQGIAEDGGLQQVTVTALGGTILLLAFRAADVPRIAMIAAAGFAVVILGLIIVSATAGGIGEGADRAMNAVLVAFAPPAVVVGIVREIRASQQVRLPAVMSPRL